MKSMAASEAAQASGLPPKVEPCSLGGQFAHARADQHGAHRQAAGDGFGQAKQVGLQGVVLVGEHLAGAAKAGLDFVEDQQRAAFAAELLRAQQEFGGGRGGRRLRPARLPAARRRSGR